MVSPAIPPLNITKKRGNNTIQTIRAATTKINNAKQLLPSSKKITSKNNPQGVFPNKTKPAKD